MGYQSRNPILRETRETNRNLARIQRLVCGVSSYYQLDAILRREIPTDDELRGAVRKLLLPFVDMVIKSNERREGDPPPAA